MNHLHLRLLSLPKTTLLTIVGLCILSLPVTQFSANAQQHRHHEATKILLDYLATEDAGLQAVRQNRNIAQEGIVRAESANDPLVNATLNASKSYSRIDQRVGNGNRVDSNFNDHDLAASLELSKTVLDWGRRDSQMHSAQVVLAINEENIRKETETTYLAALNAYYTTLRSLARVQLRQKNLQTLQSKLTEAQSRLNAGLNNATQLAVAEAGLALGESNLAQEKSRLESALNDLRIFAPKGFEQYIPETVIFPTPNPAVQDIALVAALEQQKLHSPTIASQTQAITQAKAQLMVLQKANSPNVALSLNANRAHGNGNTNSRNTTASAALTLNIPILSSGTVSSDIRAQKQRISQAQMQYRATLDRQSALLKRSWSDFHALTANLSAGQKNITARQALLSRAQSALKVGQFTASQVLDEEEKLLEAELQVIDTQYQQLLKGFEITNLIGWSLSEHL